MKLHSNRKSLFSNRKGSIDHIFLLFFFYFSSLVVIGQRKSRPASRRTAPYAGTVNASFDKSSSEGKEDCFMMQFSQMWFIL